MEVHQSKQEQPILPELRIARQDVRAIVRLGCHDIDHPLGSIVAPEITRQIAARASPRLP
ncbi:MAG: hypothetical protein ACRECU_08985 [Methylocella sp.]